MLIVALLAAAPVTAIVYLVPTDESLVDRSPIIVYGTVGPARPGPPHESHPTTDFSFHVEQVLRGAPKLDDRNTMTVRQAGGVTPGGLARMIVGLRPLASGDRALLFLDPHLDVYRTVSFGLGMFVETPAPGGSVLLRDAEGPPQADVDRGVPGATGAATTMPRDARRFRRWVSDRSSDSVRRPDYFVAHRPVEPAAVVSAYNLLRPSFCGHANALERWREFQDGETVNIVVQAEGMPGIPNGGLAGVRRGIQAWNDAPDSNVRLTMTLSDLPGQELQLAGDQFENYFNTLVFEDPLDDEPGTWAIDDHWVLGWTAISIPCEAAFSGGPPDEELLHPVPHHPEGALAYPIIDADITTENGLAKWLETKSDPDIYIAELIAHEVGHLLGIGHSCAPDPASWTVENIEAAMRPWAHHDGRGASLNADDWKAARELYATGPWRREGDPPRPPTGSGPEEPPPVDPGPTPEITPGPGRCRASARTLCLNDNRYLATAHWATRSTPSWQASVAERLNANSGYFWFFNADNVEVVVKVLDGCNVNGHHWVFAAGLTDVATSLEVTELATGNKRVYRKTDTTRLMGTVTDTSAFPCAEGDRHTLKRGRGPVTPPWPPSVHASGADRSGQRNAWIRAIRFASEPAAPAYLLGDRYRIEGEWRTDRERGRMHGIPITEDTMGFHFFDADNTEVVIKVLDGCAINGHVWVWMAGLTDVGTRISVTDTGTGRSLVEQQEPGTRFTPMRNLTAFSCSAN